MWTYKGISVFPADRNSSGIRWYARTSAGILRADSKAGMRQLIQSQERQADKAFSTLKASLDAAYAEGRDHANA